MDRPPRARSRRHPDGKGRAPNRPVVTRLNVTGPAVAPPLASPAASDRPDVEGPVIDQPAVDQPRLEPHVADRSELDRPDGDRSDVAPADVPRPWWFARAMYGLVVMVALGAGLVWLSTGGLIAIVVAAVAVATAIPAITLARREPREPASND